jgi:murein DD-endopeptidase MepM/ murein hydrolase activator NlpD
MILRLILLVLLFIPLGPPDSEPVPVVVQPTATPAPVVTVPAPNYSNSMVWPLPPDCLELRPYSVNADGSPNGYNARDHRGWDIQCREDALVYAVSSGELSVEGRPGNLTLYVRSGPLVVLYGHVKTALASGHVEQGQAIGALGAHSGPHLHIEIRLDGVPVDPAGWLPGGWYVRAFVPMDLGGWRLGD